MRGGLFRSIRRPDPKPTRKKSMSSGSSFPFENAVRVGGRNVGPSMSMAMDDASQSGGCGSRINIYVNTEVHGISNSMLTGNDVILGDVGVGLRLQEDSACSTREMDSGKYLLLLLMMLMALVVLLVSVSAAFVMRFQNEK